VEVPFPVQFIPSVEVAIVFPPDPTANHIPLPNATDLPAVVKILVPIPVQVIPESNEYAIVFPPEPTATPLVSFHAMA